LHIEYVFSAGVRGWIAFGATLPQALTGRVVSSCVSPVPVGCACATISNFDHISCWSTFTSTTITAVTATVTTPNATTGNSIKYLLRIVPQSPPYILVQPPV
jgi:hypothetical protein